MNFVISRDELIALTGIGRTETFALQKAGKLQSLAGETCKSWFELSKVLTCIAECRNLPPPDEKSMEMLVRITVELRAKKQTERKHKSRKF